MVIQGKRNPFRRKMCFDATPLGKISSAYPGISSLKKRNQKVELLLKANYRLVAESLFTMACLDVPILSLFHFMVLPLFLLPTSHLSLPRMLAFSDTKTQPKPQNPPQRNSFPSIFCLFSTQKLIKLLSFKV